MNLIQLRRIDCIHKHVCFHNGIKCGEFICSDIQPEAKERTCTLEDTTSPANDDYWNSARCSLCGAEFTCAIFGAEISAPDAFYCPNCGARVVVD